MPIDGCKMRNALAYIMTAIVVALLVGLNGVLHAADQEMLAQRREYNDVSAAVDSLVRMMQIVDAEALKGPKLPDGRDERIVPEGMTAVMIFWADDEAQIWLNDFPVGETRLTPVEVTVPDLYFKGQNRLRARCWDTDWVESGFLCGLYLKDGAGGLHPIVVSNGKWETTGGFATEITYAHPAPDIPGAETIWGERVFGVVELAITFDQDAIESALEQTADAPATPMTTKKQAMDYHVFARQMALLQARRENLQTILGRGSDLNVPTYDQKRGRSASLSLGKAGPLTEDISAPVAEKVRSWSQKLSESQQQLIYPDPRALKGEIAANLTDGGAVSIGGDRGSREQAYTPPEERGGMPLGKTESSEKSKGVKGQSNLEGQGQDGTVAGGGGGFVSQVTRLGLLLPTFILGMYVLYVISNWRTITGERG